MKTIPRYYIGGLPHTEPESAIEFVKRTSMAIPFLPQLPGANQNDDMIGQVLRGFDIGYWDEEASIALPWFLDAFQNAFRVRIQIAGPMTVASHISTSFEEIAPQWLALVSNIVQQFRSAGMQAEFWVQIDEPIWSRDRRLPPSYLQLLKLAETLDKSMAIGMHGCAPNRPEVPPHIRRHLRFLSLNFLEEPMTEEEDAAFSKMGSFGQHFIAGCQRPDGTFADVGGSFPWNRDKIWVSTACGLSELTVEQVDKLAGL